jgi:23S rRNA pseudouridine1911/1915/1917 synthase
VFVHQIWCEHLASRSLGTKFIEQGFIQVNQQTVKPSLKLKEGDTVVLLTKALEPQGAPEPHEGPSTPLNILYEDEHILVLNKPAGLVVHPGAGTPGETLVHALVKHCGPQLPSLGPSFRAGLVHRLDKDTSGVMVVGKTHRALVDLSNQFASHTQKRLYHAIVFGYLKLDHGTIETYHVRDPRNRLRFVAPLKPQGRQAITSYKVLKTHDQPKLSLVECTLQTGRTHQIRLHMEHLGNSIVGDGVYDKKTLGTAQSKPWEMKFKKLVHRQMLHAKILGFRHPVLGTEMTFEAPYPEDFELFLNLWKI